METYVLLAKDFIATIGFPIFVAVLLLYRVDNMHAANLRALEELRIAVLDRHLAVHCRHSLNEQRRRSRRRRKK